ncbi:MAG: magnesium transporter MgtE N-terminal domain-containing protein, partial [Erythrobacter sp.]
MADNRILDDDLQIAEIGEGEVRPDDRVDDERLDSENRLKADYVSAIREALDAGDKGAAYDLVEPLHPADIADLIELLDRAHREALIVAITDLMSGDVIAELNDYVREDLMEALPAQAVATIAEQLDTDDAVQLIEDLDEADQRAVIAELEPETREAVSSALAYPEETAGRLMSRHFVAVPEHLTVGDLIDYLREEGD